MNTQQALCVAAWGFLLACLPAGAQHESGYEAPRYVGSPAGTVITGQDGFYIPVPGSQDGLVYTYAGNALGLPQNPTGLEQFVGVTGGDTALPVPFARAQRDVTYGAGTGVWTVCFDVAATYLGVLPSANNIGSFSTQLFAAPRPSQQTFVCLAQWTDPATAAGWNATYLWFTAANVQENVAPNPGFQNLLPDHWYRWCTVFDLDTNQILQVSITDLTTGVTAEHVPVDRYMFGGTTGSATGPPTGFRYFGGTTAAGAAGNTLAFDNLAIHPGVTCPWDCGGVADGQVSVVDFLALLGQWGQAGVPCDFDGGGVSVTDFLQLLGAWGPCPECADDGLCVDGDNCTLDQCIDGRCVHVPVTPCCGNGVLEQAEECDPPADGDCPGQCQADCTCLSNCCVPHPGQGCDDLDCQKLVCSDLPLCCFIEWTQECADVAAVVCGFCQ